MQEVDVIIPTFNNTEQLREAVNSCKRQTYKLQNIYIVDDGSKEQIKNSLTSEYRHDTKVTLILNNHSGLPGVARQTGINASSAKWIAFLDSDDIWEDHKIETQLKFAQEQGADFVYSNASTFGSNIKSEKFLENLPLELNFSKLSKTNWIINSSTFMRRSIFEKPFSYATGSRLRAVEDYATWLRISTKFRMVGIDETLVNYRISESSIRSQDNSDPRIYAFADFLEWSKKSELMLNENFRRNRKQLLSHLRNEYV